MATQDAGGTSPPGIIEHETRPPGIELSHPGWTISLICDPSMLGKGQKIFFQMVV